MRVVVGRLLQLVMLRIRVSLHRFCNVKATAKDSQHHNEVKGAEHGSPVQGA
jgi:hypothetical protein